MRNALLAVLVALLGASAFADGKDAKFSAPKGKVFDVALEVVNSKWRIEQANKETGLITFRSLSSDGSLLVAEADGRSIVTVNTQQRGRAIWSGGERNEALKLIGQKLWKAGLIPLSEVPGAPKPTK